MTNATGVAQQQNQETVEKLNKIPTQNQTSEASKGQSSLSQKENVSSVVQTNFAQKQHTSSKANQSAKSSQSSQANQSTLPDTGDVSSLGLGALGAVLMTASFALKGSKHSR
jgi:LPXTG-motif cell wall-anchored protein